jgi:hypothetical protein
MTKRTDNTEAHLAASRADAARIGTTVKYS